MEVAAQEGVGRRALGLLPKMSDQLPRLRHLGGVLHKVRHYVWVGPHYGIIELGVILQE